MKEINNKFITRKILFGSSSKNNDTDCLHIAYGTDSNFMLGCAISISSIIKFNPEKRIVFYIFTDRIDDDYIDKFQQLSEIHQCGLQICLLDETSLQELPTNKLWSVAIYYRLLIADYFKNITGKVLYLDSDVICQNDITSLLDINLDSKVCAAVPEKDSDWWLNRAEKLANKEISKGYFNSGVMLINTVLWADLCITQQAMDILSNPAKLSSLTYYDQDVLNMICAGKVIYLEKEFNVQYSINYELKRIRKNPIMPDSVFIHYIGPTKPWHQWAKYPCTQLFINLKNESPWLSSEFLAPTNVGQWRYAAKHYIRKGNWALGISAYTRYFGKKILCMFIGNN